MTADAQLRKRDMEDFCDNPCLHPNPAPQVVNCDRVLKYLSPPQMASGWLQEGKDSALLKGQAAESLFVLQ